MRSRRLLATVVTLVLAGSLALTAQASAGPPAGPGHAPSGQGSTRVAYRNACGPAGPNQARCFALFATGPPAPAATATPTQTVAYGPAELRAAYAIPSTGGDGQTVAVVIAYDHPNAEADLAQYRAHFGLPPCTTANGCFRKMSQRGDSVVPRADVAWAQEASVDLDMVSAVCPRCHILLVEADTSNLANLVVAVAQAASRGAAVINNSYGVPESSAVRQFNDSYNLPGHAITAATGDGGYRVYFPASSQHVTAVSGTTLSKSSSGRGWNEAVWAGTGSGCSTQFTKPGWQADKGCAKRTVADVSAVADPGTGVAVYHSYGVTGGPWFTAGGTSVATPIVAGLYALAGNATTLRAARRLYRHRDALFDVVSGGNGACGGSYLCTATAGYDGPSGLGTPNGLGAF